MSAGAAAALLLLSQPAEDAFMITTIPALLTKHYANMSAVARELGVTRYTVANYARDDSGAGHVVYNGVLMTASKKGAKFQERQSPSKTQAVRDELMGKVFVADIGQVQPVKVTDVYKNGRGYAVTYAEIYSGISGSMALKKFRKEFKC